MGERIEDLILGDILESQGIKRTKDMYKKADYLHICRMCGEASQSGYKLTEEYTRGNDTPYVFLCSECYNELESESEEQ